jgi:hypothetical protein
MSIIGLVLKKLMCTILTANQKSNGPIAILNMLVNRSPSKKCWHSNNKFLC